MKKVSTDKARQGRQGKPVLYVLFGGLALAAAAALVLQPFEDAEIAETQPTEENISVE